MRLGQLGAAGALLISAMGGFALGSLTEPSAASPPVIATATRAPKVVTATRTPRPDPPATTAMLPLPSPTATLPPPPPATPSPSPSPAVATPVAPGFSASATPVLQICSTSKLSSTGCAPADSWLVPVADRTQVVTWGPASPSTAIVALGVYRVSLTGALQPALSPPDSQVVPQNDASSGGSVRLSDVLAGIQPLCFRHLAIVGFNAADQAVSRVDFIAVCWIDSGRN
jgi:hypothetical protein